MYGGTSDCNAHGDDGGARHVSHCITCVACTHHSTLTSTQHRHTHAPPCACAAPHAQTNICDPALPCLDQPPVNNTNSTLTTTASPFFAKAIVHFMQRRTLRTAGEIFFFFFPYFSFLTVPLLDTSYVLFSTVVYSDATV